MHSSLYYYFQKESCYPQVSERESTIWNKGMRQTQMCSRRLSKDIINILPGIYREFYGSRRWENGLSWGISLGYLMPMPYFAEGNCFWPCSFAKLNYFNFEVEFWIWLEDKNHKTYFFTSVVRVFLSKYILFFIHSCKQALWTSTILKSSEINYVIAILWHL